MRQKLKPCQDLEEVQSDLIETVCFLYSSGKSIRAVAKEMEMSPMKVRKILITGGVYSTELSTEIGELYRDGKTVSEIAELLNTSNANVNSYLPYERIVYNMEEKSAEADRQQRYRDRKKGLIPPVSNSSSQEALDKVKTIERMRTETMVFIIGKKLRKMLPEGVFDNVSDPLSRDHSYTWGERVNGEFVLHEPADPDKSIWCAEVTTNGRGDKKKQGIVLMSANCGFAVVAPLPEVPTLSSISSPSSDEGEEITWEERERIEQENKEKLKEYRKRLETVFIETIRSGMLKFCLPENRVLDYTDTVGRIELVKGKTSTPGIRLEELISRELKWKKESNPVKNFNVKINWTSRKFGNGDYRRVDDVVVRMLDMTEEEKRQWFDDFSAPIRERLAEV